MTPRVKICGLVRRADAEAAAAAGADYLGVVLAPGGRRSVDLAAARALFSGLPVRRVAVTVNASAGELRGFADALSLAALQLHGDEPPELAAELRDSGVAVWKAVRPRGAADFLAAVARFTGAADALLLDGWSPQARGGTGARFPWDEVGALRSEMPPSMELIVAGGLRPENVAHAIGLLRPHAVDVSSGVERAPGVKDPDRIRSFVAAARGAPERIPLAGRP